MNIKNRFIKIRFSPDEYLDITRKADRLGLNRCDYIRNQLHAVHKQLDLREELQALRALAENRLDSLATSQQEPIAETLLMVRELLASRDPQAIGRVKAQLRQQFGTGGGQ
jgi:hypothetical protein